MRSMCRSVNKFDDVPDNKFGVFCQILAESECLFELWVIFAISSSVKMVNVSASQQIWCFLSNMDGI
jgi:hypothetical protein